MKRLFSLQRRLGIWLGMLLTVTWLVAAAITTVVARHEIDKVFDYALQETAQRLLPLAVADIVGREQDGITQRLAQIRDHDELISYIVRDAEGRILLQSHDADPQVFPAWTDVGFVRTPTHVFYSEQALQGSVRLTVAELLSHRNSGSRDILLALGLPILVLLPIALIGVLLIVRTSLSAVRRFRNRLATRSAHDLSLIPDDELPAEVEPLAIALNELLSRLNRAFESERSFTANAAHELRTPLAGAIAQVQRLRAEVSDPTVRSRTLELERTLKRMTRLSESLMQLARAESSRIRLDKPSDLRQIIQLLVDDLTRAHDHIQISTQLPDQPFMSDVDPDIFAILMRNLLENAVRHGHPDAAIEVVLTEDGHLTVANDSDVIPQAVLSGLTNRFDRGLSDREGSGLGLAIVNTIAQRIGSELQLRSPRTRSTSGFEATLQIPMVPPR